MIRFAMTAQYPIRDATEEDLPSLVAILNAEVEGGVGSWAITPWTVADMAAWRASRLAAGYPVLAAHDADAVLGYGALGPFRLHDAYRHTAELSVYVAAGARERGVGGALLTALEARARLIGMRVIVGAIGSENVASLALHARHGFAETGRMPEVGRKFGRWLDLVLVQKRL